MNPTTTRAAGQPTLRDLMVRFLANRSDAVLAAAVEPAEGDVEPFEVAAGFRADPRAAWLDAVVMLEVAGASAPSKPAPLPTDWASLVAQPAAAFAVPMAAGNFPQRMKDVHPLLVNFDAARLRPAGDHLPSPGLSGLRTWIVREAKKDQPNAAVLAAGVARAIGEIDWAAELLAAAEEVCRGEYRTAWENERAALLWQQGKSAEALAAWEAMPETPTVLFNRGMASLFLGRFTEARAALTQAAQVLPESSGWHALARLYLSVAEIQG